MKGSATQRHFFLSCDSSKVTELTSATGKYVYSFGTAIDAIIGANLISYNLAKILNLLNPWRYLTKNLGAYTQNLISGATKLLFLIGSFPNFYGAEPFWDTLNFVLLLTSLVLSTYSIIKGTLKTVIVKFILPIVTPMANFVGLLVKGISVGAFLGALWGLVPIIASIMVAVACRLSF